MAKNDETKNAQLNVLLTGQEFSELERICEAENIKRPSQLVGIWIRANIKARAGVAQLLELVREAQAAGVDVAAVLTRAKARASK